MRSLPCAVLLMTLGAGCNGGLFGDDGGDDGPAEDCSGQGLPADATGLPVRAASLGEGTKESAFVLWPDGQEVPYQVGGQGFTMITPYARVESDAADDDSLCVAVRIEHWNPDGTPYEDVETGNQLVFSDYVVFDRSGEHHYAGPLFDVMYDAPENQPLELRTRIIGPDFAAEGSVDVVLVY